MNSKRKRLWRECIALFQERKKDLGWSPDKWKHWEEYSKILRKDELRHRRDAMFKSGSLSEKDVESITRMLESDDESNWEVARGIMEFKKQEAKRERLSKAINSNEKCNK